MSEKELVGKYELGRAIRENKSESKNKSLAFLIRQDTTLECLILYGTVGN